MWLKDPISNKPSVALTILAVSVSLMIGGIVMECFTNLRSTHLLDELFGAAMTLYGGHMFALRNTTSIEEQPSLPNPQGPDSQTPPC